jgi:hypothetical protein
LVYAKSPYLFFGERAFCLISGVATTSIFLTRYFSLLRDIPIFNNASFNSKKITDSLIEIGISSALTIFSVSSYFRTQLPRPPTKKKSLWKIVSEYVSSPFHGLEKKPTEVPVEDYQHCQYQ